MCVHAFTLQATAKTMMPQAAGAGETRVLWLEQEAQVAALRFDSSQGCAFAG